MEPATMISNVEKSLKAPLNSSRLMIRLCSRTILQKHLLDGDVLKKVQLSLETWQ